MLTKHGKFAEQLGYYMSRLRGYISLRVKPPFLPVDGTPTKEAELHACNLAHDDAEVAIFYKEKIISVVKLLRGNHAAQLGFKVLPELRVVRVRAMTEEELVTLEKFHVEANEKNVLRNPR